MPDKKEQFNAFFSALFFIGFGLGFISIFFSPFLTSLGSVLVALSVLPFIKKVIEKHGKVLLPFAVLLLASIFDLIRSSNMAQSVHQLSFVLTFILLFTAGLYHFNNQNRRLTFILIAWITLITLAVNVHAVLNYFGNREAIDILLSQGKSIPLINHFHHIHFGVINSLVLLILGYLIYSDERFRKIPFYIGFGVILICFHILSSRTGLLALYATVGLLGVFIALRTRKFKLLGIGAVISVLFVLTSYKLSSSFRAKVDNSIEDYESWGSPENINFKSMAMRMEAYKMTFSVFKQHPLIGVGVTRADECLQAEYERQNSPLIPINRIRPHNQYLEWAMKYGFIGILLLPLFFGIECSNWKTHTWLYLSILSVLAISLFFESLFERQASIFFMALFLSLGRSITPR